MFNSRCIYIIAFLGLTACGGGEEVAPNEHVEGPIEQPLAVSIDLTGKAGTPLAVATKVEGQQSTSNSNVNSGFSNALGGLRHIDSSANVQGNLTLGVTASDSDVMQSVSLYLPNVGRAFELCSTNCPTTFQTTITGFNPQLANEVAGPLRIELVVVDSLGNSAIVDALSINWQPIQINAVNASRNNGVVNVSWSGNSSLARYNVYAATSLGLTTDNALALDNGIQQLAIEGTSAQFIDAQPSKDYHLLITGIENGGESGLSSPYIIPRIIGVTNQPPVANNERYSVNEDETISGNVLDNDVEPDGQVITFDAIVLQPLNGKLSIDVAGNFTYQPNANFNGSDSASYRIKDTEGATSQATVVFDVLAVNDNPNAADDTYGVDVEGKINATQTNLLLNDSDIDGDTLQISTTPVSPPQRGVVVINSDGSFAYQASGVLLESDQFVYQVSDDAGGIANATVNILPNGSTLPPVAVNDSYQIDEDNTLVISTTNQGILANDSDPNDLAIELVETLLIEPQNGRLNLALDGTFTYIPNSNFVGIDQFQYQIKNSAGLFTQAFVTITVNPIADIPVALNDNYQVDEDTALLVDAASGLLLNDVNFDGTSLKVNTTPVSPPLKGTLTLVDDGSFSYLPNSDFHGIDSFSYQIINDAGLTNTANVNIVVLPLNDAPIAVDDIAQTNEDTQIIVDVLANDIDKDGDALTLTGVSLNNGSANIVAGKLNITPALNFFGVISVTYTVTDSQDVSSNGTLLLTVLPVNDAPVAVDDNYTLLEDAVLRVLATSNNHLLSNDSDVDGDVLTVNTTPVSPAATKQYSVNTTPLSDVSNGSLTLNSDGSFSYIPQLNFNGSDSFIYQVMDSNGGVAEGRVTLTVGAVNDIPVALDDSYSLSQDSVLNVPLTASNHLLSNDSDDDGDILTVSLIQGATNGTLSLNSDGSFSYTPNLGFIDTDGFTYQIDDGNGGVAQAKVTLTILGGNTIPVASDDSYSFNEDVTWVRAVTDGDQLLSNDNDADGDTLTVNTTPVSDVTNGVLTLSANGAFSYVPALNFNGTDSFTYEVTDGRGATAQATVTLIVHPVNDIPVVASTTKSFTFDEDSLLSKSVSDGDNLLSGASDVDGDSLTVVLSAGVGANGNLTLNSDGSFSYSASTNFNGADAFSYVISDGSEFSEMVTVSLNIQAVNDAPVPDADSFTFSLNENASEVDVVGTVSASDIESDTLTYTLTDGDTNLFTIDSTSGVMTVQGINPFDYETSTSHSVTVTITDNGSPVVASSDVPVTINIIDIVGDAAITEDANFGRTTFGSLELSPYIDKQAQLTDSVIVSGVAYYIGTLDGDIYLTSYDANGTLNTGFGDSGIKVFDFGNNESGRAIIHDTKSFYIAFNSAQGAITEACFIKLSSTGDFVSTFGNNGLVCTAEQKIFSINDLIYDDFDILAVGKVQGDNDDTLIIQVNEDTGAFIDHTVDPTTIHLIQDISGLGLDDEAIAVHRPKNFSLMLTGNVITANGDSDVYAWQIDSAGKSVSTFNIDGSPKFYDVNGTDDKVQAIGGIAGNNFTVYLAGSTVIASGAADASLFAIDDTGSLLPGFGVNGIAKYDADGDGGAGTGSGEFTAIVASGSELYVSGTLLDGNKKPFITRVFQSDGAIDTINYGINGFQEITYQSNNAFSLSLSLDNAKSAWLAGYVESGSDKRMIISAVDSAGQLTTAGDFVEGKNTLTSASTPSDDIAAQVIQIQSGTQAGKFLIASTADNTDGKHIILSRLTNTGQIDTTFDSDGHLKLKVGASATVKGLLELSSGDFIVYGNVIENINSNGFIARIDQNGLLDSSFADSGIYTTSAITATNIVFNQAAVDSLGRIVAVGYFDSGSISAFTLRLTTGGLLDTSFNIANTGGYVIGESTDNYTTVAIGVSDTIYAGGSREGGDKDLLMVSYLSTGALSNTTVVDITAGVDETVEKLLFDSNNDLYWVGNDIGASSKVVIVKSNVSGVLDNSFSSDGKASINIAPVLDLGAVSAMTDARVDTNNNIVLVGYSELSLTSKKQMIARIKPNGSLDVAFDNDGYYRATSCSFASQLASILMLNNSSFIVAGHCYINSSESNNIDVSRYSLN